MTTTTDKPSAGFRPDDRPEPPDRAAEDVSPWDVDPAELRDLLSHAPVGEYLDWLRA